MKTDARWWQYLTEFFLEWEKFQIKFVEKIKTHILCKIIPPPLRKSSRAGKYGTAKQATDDNIILWMRFACWIETGTHNT